MKAEPDIAVEVTCVSHVYRRTRALDRVSLSFAAGSTTALIGPDGVGKSTLLGLIAGVRRIREGGIRVFGGDMADRHHRGAVCRRIAYMPQGLGRNLYPTMSVSENIDFHARLYGQDAVERAWRIADLLHSTGLDPFPDRPAGKLSGGMKQKLSLCCALVHDPDLLILDEPTTGVDPLSRRQFWNLIERVQARRPGMTIIVATAYMSEAEQFTDLVAMDEGRVLMTGSPERLRTQTGAATLEQAFIDLLPAERRGDHAEIVRPPRTSHEGPPAIEADELSMRFGDFTAVDKVSFRIETGEIFGFLGSNGCGKTTTMKMLTGLLTPSEGSARLFGRAIGGHDGDIRRRVGYMSQSFSLYSELSVRQNLNLHADLFQLSGEGRKERLAELAERFDLTDVLDRQPGALPLGVRQRLQLAVAVLHKPELLILDEPTSGVDPIARDDFWRLLIDLSRQDGVTIFISTHFMNEAERCDRVSLMHAGRVLAVGTPEDLSGARSLEEVFIDYLAEAAEQENIPSGNVPSPIADSPVAATASTGGGAVQRVWAFARREAIELLRDPIRLAFALIGPVILMLAMGFGISFDVEDLTYAVHDQDRSRESRHFLEQFSGSRYFKQKPALASFAELDQRMQAGDIGLAVVVPPGFGRDLLAGKAPELAYWLDGSDPTRAQTARGYAESVYLAFLTELAREEGILLPATTSADLEIRFRYNQAFRSVYAIPPGILMMMLIMIPAMLTAVGVVREKELGSITNLYAAPARKIEFLVGKQLPYVAVAMVSFAILVALMLFVFGLQVRGDPIALVTGALAYAFAATAFGLVVSTFVGSQIAAVFASSIIVMIPTVNFSGMLYPVATLEGGARVIGQSFPSQYFQQISTGVFNKGLGFGDLYINHLILFGFCLLYLLIAVVLLKKQEA